MQWKPSTCHFKTRSSLIFKEDGFWGAALSTGCWQSHRGPVQSPCMVMAEALPHTFKVWWLSSEGNFSALGTKVLFIFTPASASLLYIKTHWAKFWFFLKKNINLLCCFFHPCQGFANGHSPYACFATLSCMLMGMYMPCSGFLQSDCITFTDFFPFSLVPNMKLHVNSMTPLQKY